MVRTESTALPVGSPAPAFTLPDTRTGQSVSTASHAGSPLLIAFICNHCPYVVHLIEPFAALANAAAAQGLMSIAISANDVVAYPQDGPLEMAKLAEKNGFAFPYCYDESQEVARAYDAVCTPDLYLFDAAHRLFYRGQFDNTRPGRNEAAHGANLRAAIERLLAGEDAPVDPAPSVGCSIKWRRN